MGKAKFDWTADAIARLHELVAEKLTAAQIADRLGPGVLTRNAVIGKTHREKIKLQTPPNVTGRHKAAEPEPRRVADAPIAAFRVLAPVRHDRGVPYLQLEHWHCKALLDQRGRDGLSLCCGRRRCEDATGGLTPYCAEHLRLYTTHAYVPRRHRG
jgi:hypothetical protein